MDALSLSTEATYGADSKRHMFVEEATFAQCLFLRPANLWKITILFNTADFGLLILSFNFCEIICSQNESGHVGLHSLLFNAT